MLLDVIPTTSDPRVIFVVLVAFLLGSIPFGVLLARARGIDLKKVGSGNIGATNAARALGKKAGVVVLLLDTAKAWLPTAAALRLQLGPEVAAVAGFAAFTGHIYSPWLKGRGGKGVACGLGAFLALAPACAGIAAAVCGVAGAGVVAAARAARLRHPRRDHVRAHPVAPSRQHPPPARAPREQVVATVPCRG